MQAGLIHHFNVEIACEVGVNAAVVAANIQHWCAKNEANESERHFHNERYWTFNSISAFEKLFPYLTIKQIRTALDKLERAEIIVSGRFNKDTRDRTKWYSYNGIEQRVMHLPLKADEICPEGQLPFAPEGRPLPDNKPNNKPNITLARARERAPWMGSLLDALGKHCTASPALETALVTLSEEVEAFDGRRVLIKSRFMADRVNEALGHALKAANLRITTNPADMQLEGVD
jgi:hypothetical protein